MNRCFAALLILAAPAFGNAGDDDVRAELKALKGKWKAVALEAGGQKLPKESVPDFTFIVGDGGKSTGKMADSEYESMMIVDPRKSPKTIDNEHKTGSQKGKKQYGIYKLEDGKWVVCMTAPGAAAKNRPKSFNTKESTSVLFIFERVKEEKK